MQWKHKQGNQIKHTRTPNILGIKPYKNPGGKNNAENDFIMLKLRALVRSIMGH
jgi:hypothetical protein